jgi:oligopeptide transport system substrate-binding protein
VSRDRLKALLASSLLLALLFAALVLSNRTAHSRSDFAFCNQSEPSSLDPAISTGSPAARLARALFEGLTRLDPSTNQALPGVAERWTTSPDGLTWDFYLRDDARWSNGDEVTATDFEYSLRRVLDPSTASRNAYLLWCLDGAEAWTSSPPGDASAASALGIEAISPRHLRLRLQRPAPYLDSLLAYPTFSPVHRACIEQHGARWIKPENMVSNGPFTLAERRLRDRIRLEKSETYWGRDDVSLQSVVAYAAGGITTQLNMFLLGEVDWIIKPPPGLYSSLEGRQDLVVGEQFGSTFMRFNTWGGPFADPKQETPFSDIRVREALTLALDREDLAKHVMRGGQQALNSFVPAGIPDYKPAMLAKPDADRAKALLAEAGYPEGEGFPRFALLYPHNETTRDFCEAVATRWRRTLGIQCELVNQVFGVYLDSTSSGLYDVAWGAWIGDYLDPSSFLEIFLSNSGNNRTGWANPQYDSLVQEASGSPNIEDRAKLFRQAEEILLEELPIAPVYQRVNINLVAPRVEGFHDNLLDAHPLRDIKVKDTAG